MQTTLNTEHLLSERRFQLSSHAPSVPRASVPRAIHSRDTSGTLSASSQYSARTDAPRDISTRFGARLRELRRERNLTQLRMANEFGIDRSFISDVERGRKSISLPMLEVIALGMKITLSDLLQDI